MEARATDRQFPIIERLEVGEADRLASRQLLENHIRREALKSARDHGHEELVLSEAGLDLAKAHRQATDLAAFLQQRKVKTLDLEISGAFQLISPPYDVGWSLGAAAPLANWDGSCLIFGGDGFSASGFGIYLTTPKACMACLVPQGEFQGSWANFSYDAAPNQRTSAGSGVVVYQGDNLLVSRQPTIWNVRGMSPFAGATFHMPFADTATPPIQGSFGPIPLAPVLFEMQPGARYLVWFYVWQNNSPLGKGVITACSASVKLISVTTGPPLNIH